MAAEQPSGRDLSQSQSADTSISNPLELGVDFLVSPRCYQLYSVALKSSSSPVPHDWSDQLAAAVENVPTDATVQELIKVVAAISPDRARTLIQVLEEEVSVMEDVVDHEALERIKRLRREQQSELRALSTAAKNVRAAALDAHRQLSERFPCFDWDSYHHDPSYLQGLVYERGDAEKQAEHDKLERIIEDSRNDKKFLLAELDEQRERRAMLQRRLDEGCYLDRDEELEKARRENQLLRDHYQYLYNLAEEQRGNNSSSDACPC